MSIVFGSVTVIFCPVTAHIRVTRREPYKGNFTGTLHGRLFSGVEGCSGIRWSGWGSLVGVAVGWISGVGMGPGDGWVGWGGGEGGGESSV